VPRTAGEPDRVLVGTRGWTRRAAHPKRSGEMPYRSGHRSAGTSATASACRPRLTPLPTVRLASRSSSSCHPRSPARPPLQRHRASQCCVDGPADCGRLPGGLRPVLTSFAIATASTVSARRRAKRSSTATLFAGAVVTGHKPHPQKCYPGGGGCLRTGVTGTHPKGEPETERGREEARVQGGQRVHVPGGLRRARARQCRGMETRGPLTLPSPRRGEGARSGARGPGTTGRPDRPRGR
jgi:hypothetical protein